MSYVNSSGLVARNYQTTHQNAQPLRLPASRAEADEQADMAVGFGLALIGFGLLLKFLIAR